jgi:hypothetical protein
MLYGREGRSSCGCDGMVVGFITTYVISAYHHLRCEFESRSWRGMLNKYTTLCDQVRQQLSVCRWFSSTNKTDRHYITEILLKVALSKITPNAGRMENLNIENLKRQKHAKSYSSELSKPF